MSHIEYMYRVKMVDLNGWMVDLCMGWVRLLVLEERYGRGGLRRKVRRAFSFRV